MRYRVIAPAVAVVLTAVACGESPQQPEPSAQFQFQDGSIVCDYNRGAHPAARALFSQPAEREVRSLLRDMEGAPDPNPIGFDVIARVRDAVGTAEQQGTVQDASDLINQVLACMVFDPAEAPSTPIDFTGALGSTGALDLRGDPTELATELTPVLSNDQEWGVEPANQLDDSGNVIPNPTTGLITKWSDATGGEQVLIYGTQIASGLGGEAEVGFAFDWNKIPNIQLQEDVRVATCQAITDVDQYRVSRGIQILPFSDPSTNLCPWPPPLTLNGSFGPLALLSRVVDVLRPAPLYADAVAIVGKGGGPGSGGTAGGFTPFVVVNPGAVNLMILDVIPDLTIDPTTGVATLPPISVSAYGNNDTPLPEVAITFSIKVNQSSIATLGGTTTVVTDPECGFVDSCVPTGIAIFEDDLNAFPAPKDALTLNKPGGYTLVATADLFGFTIATAETNAFHVGQ